MNFTIDKVILWLIDDTKKVLKFEKNKVNVITGDSNTGKTTIFHIIDYCLLSSDTKIPDEIINENVLWYGIQFTVNEKVYTIARGAIDSRKVSKNYYFSGTGFIPDLPNKNFSEEDLRTIIETEFAIDKSLIVPYGGKKITAGSKISFRYFLLFNTQLENTIINSEVFFDKQNIEKYREALERIFDIAIGISTPEDSLRKEKLDLLEKRHRRLLKLKNKESNGKSGNKKEIIDLIVRAKKYNLIEIETSTYSEDYENLKKVIKEYSIYGENIENETNFEKLHIEKIEFLKKLNILKKFESEYLEYKKLLKNNQDSLIPLNYLKENYPNKVEENKEFFNLLENQFLNIKSKLKNKTPLGINTKNEIQKIEKVIAELDEKIKRTPRKRIESLTDIEKYVLLGEIKEKFRRYSEEEAEEINYDAEILKIENEIEELSKTLEDYTLKKDTNKKLLEEFIQEYLDMAGDTLENYKGFKALFDYKNKMLHLRRPKFDVPSIVGSSSNHLFLHLCFFLGMHEMILNKKIPYIPNLLLLDQPSRPYYERAKKEKGTEDNILYEEIIADDRKKITKAFELMNSFIDITNKEYQKEFQFIVVEHIPEEVWKDANLKNIHLVDERFERGKNALIKHELAKKSEYYDSLFFIGEK